MARDRVRQRREFVLVGWSASGSEPSLASSGSIVEFENGQWEFMLDGWGIVRGDAFAGGRQVAVLILRALAFR
jgi:hypothetical protein